MAANIEVKRLGDGAFSVRVTEGASHSAHRVTLQPGDYDRLAQGKVEPAELVRRSFEFLLEHEPKESILARFDLTEIGRYFPDFERGIQRRLAAR